MTFLSTVEFRDYILGEDTCLPVLLHTRPSGEWLLILNGSVDMAGHLTHFCAHNDDRELLGQARLDNARPLHTIPIAIFSL